MAINITDSGSSIRLEIIGEYLNLPYNKSALQPQIRYIEKAVLTINSFADQVVLIDAGDALYFKFSDITTPSAGDAGQVATLIEAFKDSDGNAPSSSQSSTPSSDDSTTLEASSVSKNIAGVLYGFSGYNSLASDQYVQVHNASALPADGAVPLVTMVVRAQSNFSWQPPSGKFGKYFSAGIVVCNSTTIATKTIGAANCWFNLDFS